MDKTVAAFERWVTETPDAIARLRSMIGKASYHVTRVASGRDERYAMEGTDALLRSLMEAGSFPAFSAPEFPDRDATDREHAKELPLAIDDARWEGRP